MPVPDEMRELRERTRQETRDRKLPLKRLASFMKNRENLNRIRIVSESDEKQFNASDGLIRDLTGVAEAGQVEGVDYSAKEKRLTVHCSSRVLGKLSAEHASSLCSYEE